MDFKTKAIPNDETARPGRMSLGAK